jgi:multiple sugar transport system permease protein
VGRGNPQLTAPRPFGPVPTDKDAAMAKFIDDPMARTEGRTAWAFLAPFLILWVVFFGYATVRAIWFSLTDYDLFSDPAFVGPANYVRLLSDPLFLQALTNSLLFSVVVTTTQTVLAMLLAVFVNRIMRARNLVRTIFYFPSIVSSTVMTLIFLWLFQRQGLVTDAVNWFGNNAAAIGCFGLVLATVQGALVLNARRRYQGVRANDPYFMAFAMLAAILVTTVLRLGQYLPAGDNAEPISWLNTRETFLFMPWTLWAIAVINIFTTIPVMMLLYLAGLQSIPTMLYEAAEIDGASRWQMFTRITVPLLAPVTFAVVTLGMVGTLQMFDQVAIMGKAAPIESRVTLAYYTYFNSFPPGGTPRIGMASAGAIVLAVLSMILVYLQRRFGVSDKAI